MESATETIDEQIRRMTPVSAPPEQRKDVEALSKLLGLASKRRAPHCKIVGPQDQTISVPESVFYVLTRVAEVLARGDAITVVPVGKQLTTQQAADLLNVSRQYLVRLLEQDQLPYTKTGKHRRLRIEDVLAFKETRDQGRKESLDRLAQLSEDAGGYDELK